MKTLKKKRRKPQSILFWNVLCMLTVLVIGGGYVYQMSSVTQAGYRMRDLEVAVEELEIESEMLKVQVAEATSLSNVSKRMQMLGFIESESVTYIEGPDSVAVR